MVMQSKAHNLGTDEILHALASFVGVTTTDGNAGGTTLISSALIGVNDFLTGKTVIIQSGAAIYEDSEVTGFDPLTGQITVNPAFSAQIVSATTFFVLNGSSAASLAAAIAGIVAILGPANTSILGNLYNILGNPATSISTILNDLSKYAGLFLYGVVTAVPGANQFTIAALAGQGAGKFAGATNPYQAFVMRDAGGLSAAPQGEQQAITAYDTVTGTFTTGAFTAAVAVGDEILLLHPALVGGGGGMTENVAVTVNINAIAGGETDVLLLNVADTRYIVRSLRVKSVDPGVNTVYVRLYELINDVLTLVDTFDITTANFGTYFSLMDMFGLPQIVGDQLQVTVQASAGGPYAVTGEYSYANT